MVAWLDFLAFEDLYFSRKVCFFFEVFFLNLFFSLALYLWSMIKSFIYLFILNLFQIDGKYNFKKSKEYNNNRETTIYTHFFQQ